MRYFNLHKYKELRQELRNKSPKAEQMLWSKLKDSRFLELKFRRQHGIGRFVVDFYCPKLRLVIELDGDSHFNEDAVEYDRLRTEYFKSVNIKVLRFTNNDIYKNLIGVLEEIKKCVSDHPLSPSSKEEGA